MFLEFDFCEQIFVTDTTQKLVEKYENKMLLMCKYI